MAYLAYGVPRVKIEDLSDWSYSAVSSNSARVRSLGMALVVRVLVNSAKALLLPEACEQQSVSASAWDVAARATHFVPNCWTSAGRLPAADSALLIKTDNLLVWWFQGRLDHSSSPSRRFRMTSIAQRGVELGGLGREAC